MGRPRAFTLVTGLAALAGAVAVGMALGTPEASSAAVGAQAQAAIEVARATATGSADFDHTGWATAADGNIAVVGAWGRDDGASGDVGAAYVFEINGNTVSQLATLTASDGAPADNFGASVDISGDTIVVGAFTAEDAGGMDRGAAYVFTKPAGGWVDATETARLTAADSDNSDYFGQSVAVSGDTVVAGAPRHDPGGQTFAGAAYTFDKPGGGWATTSTPSAKLAHGVADALFFGEAVDIDADTVAVGAALDQVPSTDSGSVYVYTRTGGNWSLLQRLDPPGGASSDYFGKSVALSGDTLVGGAPGTNAGGVTNVGRAFVFTRSSGTFSVAATLSATSPAQGDEFGSSVATSGDRAVVGAPLADDSGASSGAAYFFARPDSGWADGIAGQRLPVTGSQAGDQVGHSVALGADLVWVGAPGTSTARPGYVGVFRVVSEPGAPSSVSASAGDGQATVSWISPSFDGGSAITSYTATASPGGATCTTTAPATSCAVTGLANGTAYTFTVIASNAVGPSASSAPSNVVMPVAPPAPSPPPVPAAASSAAPPAGEQADPCAALVGAARASCVRAATRMAAIDRAQAVRSRALEACTQRRSRSARALCTTTANATYRRSLSRASAAFAFSQARARCVARKGAARSRCLQAAITRRNLSLKIANARYARTIANQRCQARTGAARSACRRAVAARYAAATRTGGQGARAPSR